MDKETNAWYIVRTFNRQELRVRDFLREQGLTCFIPMTMKEVYAKDSEKPKRVFVPVIHNYIFVQKTLPKKKMLDIMKECVSPVSLMRRRDSSDFCEIPDREMTEFRLMCDPDIKTSVFMGAEEAEAKPGKDVMVVHGPFAGIRGKLYRTHGKHFIIKVVGELAVMVRISRWYCKVIDKKD